MSKPIRILIVDDHTVLREGLISLINPQPDLEVVGEAGTVREAVEKAIQLQPDIVLLDISLPDGSGVEAVRQILFQLPQTKITMLTIHEADDLLFDAIRSGAKGYLLKSTPIAKIIASLRAMMRGEAALTREMTSLVLGEFARQDIARDTGSNPLQSLTSREFEVLKLLRKGASNQEISRQLYISQNTVKNHVHNILAKLNLKNRREASILARRQEI